MNAADEFSQDGAGRNLDWGRFSVVVEDCRERVDGV